MTQIEILNSEMQKLLTELEIKSLVTEIPRTSQPQLLIPEKNWFEIDKEYHDWV